MDLVLQLHSLVRWLVVAVAVVTVVDLAIGWSSRRAFGDRDRKILAAFAGSMDLQALLGLIVLVGGMMQGNSELSVRMEHAVTMILALVFAHLPARWRRLEDHTRFTKSLVAVIVSLVLIFLGVARLPKG